MLKRSFAVVTGAASGMGYNLAKVLAENGFDLVIASAGERLEKAEAELEAMGADVMAVHADLSTYEGVQELWTAVEGSGRRLDAVAIQAGVGGGGKFGETDVDAEISLIRLNVESTVHLAKYAVQKMVQQGEGRVLMTSSSAGQGAVYGAAQAFALAFAGRLRAELEGTGVTVTSMDAGAEGETYEAAKQAFAAMMHGDKDANGGRKLRVEGAADAVMPSQQEMRARPLEEKKAS